MHQVALKHGNAYMREYLPAGKWQNISDLGTMNAWPDQRQHPSHQASISSDLGLRFKECDWVLKGIIAKFTMAATEIAMAKQCIHELEQAALELGSRWRVKPFGGVGNGFASRGSDLDATCYIEGMEVSYTPLATQELQTQLLPLLQKHRRFEVIDQIWTARVPILKLRFDQQLDVDLSCHNTEALPNTQLLRAYAELSPQVRELGLLIKVWAKGEGVCGASRGYLSSYALTLMAIYYLQVDPQVNIPCVPAGLFSNRHGTFPKDRKAWKCPLPTQVLLGRFFRFYATEFQWFTEVVSVRHGRRASAAEPVYDQLGASLAPRLHIEDPFLTARNLHCVLGLEQECIFYAKLCQAAEATQNGRLPAGLACSACSLGQEVPGGLRVGASAGASPPPPLVASTKGARPALLPVGQGEGGRQAGSKPDGKKAETYGTGSTCDGDASGAPRSDGPRPDGVPMTLLHVS